MKKEKQQYTTIQVSKEINQHIRKFCTEKGYIASTLTERLWIDYISSSMSGSVLL
jgi:hypothetical protein